MIISLNTIKTKYLKIGILLLIFSGIMAAIIIIKSKPQFSPVQPKTNLPQVVEDLNGKQILTPKNQRNKLPDTAENIKQEMIKNNNGENKGVLILYNTPSYKIEYIPTPDIFLVTILKTPIDQNKLAAEDWFKEFGLAENEICNLPVRFSLAIDAPDYSEQFDPFPT